jgi:hypothetical protein
MQRRSFRGEAGRPFGTVAALLCLLLAIALLVLWDVSRDLIGAADPFHADPARAAGYWGVLLAAEIVKATIAFAILLAVWTLSGPIGPRTPRSIAALALGTVGAVLLGIAAHWYIEAAAWLGDGRVSPMGAPMAMLSAAALICLGLWAGLLMLEARAARSLPGWVQGLGLLLAATCLAAAAIPALALAAVSVSVAWWAALFATLYRPEDRLRA